MDSTDQSDELVSEGSGLDWESSDYDSETGSHYSKDSKDCYDSVALPPGQIMSLCHMCEKMWSAFKSAGSKPVQLLERMDFLEMIADKTCSMCKYLVSQLGSLLMRQLKTGLEMRMLKIRITYVYYKFGSGPPLILVSFSKIVNTESISNNADYGDPVSQLCIQLKSINSKLFSGFEHRAFDYYPSSAANWPLISHWLEDCKAEHQSCQRTSNFLPARLLYLGSDLMPSLRLVEGGDLQTGTPYFTLSHCWGGEINYRLLKHNIECMLEAIVESELPKTFRHAILITRKLGVGYLWVDSLCIIQDDEQDWNKESAVMDQVYMSGHCNISATAASNSSEGLFLPRVTPIHNFITPRHISGKQKYYRFIDNEEWGAAVERSVLNSRGWVFQERMLSVCNLHFTSTEMFWECRETSASETFPKQYPDSWKAETKKEIWKSLEKPSVQQWKDIIQTYSRTRVTLKTDKLVALGGLARHWAEKTGDEYLAGIWKHHLPEALLWYCNDPSLPFITNGTYIAPSWSWASIGGPLYFYRCSNSYEQIQLVEIVKCEVECEGNNISGRLKGGCLTIKGQLALGKNRNYKKRGSCLRLIISSVSGHERNWEIYWLPDTPVVQKEEGFEAPDSTDLYPENLFLLPLIRNGTEDILGIVLAAIPDKKDIFKRVGAFHGEGDDGDINALDQGCRYFDSLASESGLEYREKRDGTFEYTIRII